MVWDLAVLLEDPKGQQSAYGGKSLLFIHPPSRVFYLHLAIRRSRRGRLFRQFLLGERIDKFKHGHSVVLLKCKWKAARFTC